MGQSHLGVQSTLRKTWQSLQPTTFRNNITGQQVKEHVGSIPLAEEKEYINGWQSRMRKQTKGILNIIYYRKHLSSNNGGRLNYSVFTQNVALIDSWNPIKLHATLVSIQTLAFRYGPFHIQNIYEDEKFQPTLWISSNAMVNENKEVISEEQMLKDLRVVLMKYQGTWLDLLICRTLPQTFTKLQKHMRQSQQPYRGGKFQHTASNRSYGNLRKHSKKEFMEEMHKLKDRSQKGRGVACIPSNTKHNQKRYAANKFNLFTTQCQKMNNRCSPQGDTSQKTHQQYSNCDLQSPKFINYSKSVNPFHRGHFQNISEEKKVSPCNWKEVNQQNIKSPISGSQKFSGYSQHNRHYNKTTDRKSPQNSNPTINNQKTSMYIATKTNEQMKAQRDQKSYSYNSNKLNRHKEGPKPHYSFVLKKAPPPRYSVDGYLINHQDYQDSRCDQFEPSKSGCNFSKSLPKQPKKQ